MKPENKTDELWESFTRDGFLILRDFLDPRQVELARQEIQKWTELDLTDRAQRHIPHGSSSDGPAGRSHLNPGKHLLIDVFGKSPALDRLFDRMLTDPVVSTLMDRLAGPNKKLRGYNIRQMTGNVLESAMEWHRDNPGEINWGIILSDSDPEVDAPTCFVPGSHLYPACPFKSTVFPLPYPDARFPTKLSLFSRLLMKRTIRNVVDAGGRPGDCYIFIGDTWHARRPNLRGKRGTVHFIGAFPTEFPFPGHTEVVIPPKDVLERLPEALRRIVDYPGQGPNTDPSSYLYRLLHQRRRRGFLTLWHLAELEKRFYDWKPIHHYYEFRQTLSRFKMRLVPYLKPVLRPFLSWRRGGVE